MQTRHRSSCIALFCRRRAQKRTHTNKALHVWVHQRSVGKKKGSHEMLTFHNGIFLISFRRSQTITFNMSWRAEELASWSIAAAHKKAWHNFSNALGSVFPSILHIFCYSCASFLFAFGEQPLGLWVHSGCRREKNELPTQRKRRVDEAALI